MKNVVNSAPVAVKPIIFFALTAVLTITFTSCSTTKTDDQSGFLQQSGWTVSREKHLPQVGWNVDTLCTYTCKDGQSRVFVDVFYHVADSYFEEYHGLYAVDDNPRDTTFIRLKYPRYEDDEDFFSYIGGIPNYLLYYPGHDNKSLYVVTRANANSNGWTTEYQLFIVNCETLEAKYICDFAAIATTDEGFRIAVTRLTNEDTATCTADEIWVMHDEYLDWSGNVIRVDKVEYDYEAMKKKYLRGEYTYVKGFYGVIL